MWLFQLLLAWMLVYWIFRLIFWNGGGKSDTARKNKESGPDISQDTSNYLYDAPDALRPDIEDEFDPSDYY